MKNNKKGLSEIFYMFTTFWRTCRTFKGLVGIYYFIDTIQNLHPEAYILWLL